MRSTREPPVRQTVLLVAGYAAFCLAWAGFADRLGQAAIAAAYRGQTHPIVDWLFHARQNLPLEHFLGAWHARATTVPLAALLHLAIVLVIRRIDRGRRLASVGAATAELRVNLVLILFAAAFLAFAVLSGFKGAYAAYPPEWQAVLAGGDPWAWIRGYPWASQPTGPLPLNAYGPLFNLFAVVAWFDPLANKALFAFAYLVFVVWLVKIDAAGGGMARLSWSPRLWLSNPFPWVAIAYFGAIDVLVGLACVAAVHAALNARDAASGGYLAAGILLKFMPAVVLPFLVFDGRRFHPRQLASCVGVLAVGVAISFLIWGNSTLLPLKFALSRAPGSSIYEVLATLLSGDFDFLEKPLLLASGLAVFAWCMWRRVGLALAATLAVLVTLLFYRKAHVYYNVTLFCLVWYWLAFEKTRRPAMLIALVGYFWFLTLLDLSNIFDWGENIAHYDEITTSLRFLFGCALLAGLLGVSSRAATRNNPLTTVPSAA
jgi:hypothetical protein